MVPTAGSVDLRLLFLLSIAELGGGGFGIFLPLVAQRAWRPRPFSSSAGPASSRRLACGCGPWRASGTTAPGVGRRRTGRRSRVTVAKRAVSSYPADGRAPWSGSHPAEGQGQCEGSHSAEGPGPGIGSHPAEGRRISSSSGPTARSRFSSSRGSRPRRRISISKRSRARRRFSSSGGIGQCVGCHPVEDRGPSRRGRSQRVASACSGGPHGRRGRLVLGSGGSAGDLGEWRAARPERRPDRAGCG